MADDEKKRDLKDNVDRPHNPKKSQRNDHLPRGMIDLSRGSYSGKSGHDSAQTYLSPERQRAERNFSKENQLNKEMRQDRQSDRRNTLSKEFDYAKARESHDHFTPAPEGKETGGNEPPSGGSSDKDKGKDDDRHR